MPKRIVKLAFVSVALLSVMLSGICFTPYGSCDPLVSSPPQASFTYSPPSPVLANITITFDASGSTAEGYGDYITSFEWNFGDGNITTVYGSPPDPVIYHKYTTGAVYTVTLNVTDNEGLWCTTSKPITIFEPTGPIANFTYSPPEPFVNAIVIFNASLSEPGWNGTIVPITSYFWDFGDGANATETDPITTHRYSVNDTFTVTLKATDQQGLWNTTSQNITVVTPVGEIHDIIILDVTISFPTVGLDTVDEAYRLWELDVNVKVKNNGTEFETFDITVSYKNITGTYTIGTQALANMAPLEETTITIKWNLANVEENYAGYTINATADIVPGEINITDNTYFGGPVKVKWLGDIDGDTHIYILDLSLLGGSWRRSVGQPGYNPQADFDGDGTVYIFDLSILGAHWREH